MTIKSTLYYYKCAGCDLEMLFGNMDEVVEVSQKLLTSLEAATKGKEFDEQIVGKWRCTAPLRRLDSFHCHKVFFYDINNACSDFVPNGSGPINQNHVGIIRKSTLAPVTNALRSVYKQRFSVRVRYYHRH